MKETKKLRAAIEEWCCDNGACTIDVKNENILLFNGGLFQDMNKRFAELYIRDLNETINYLRRLRYFLNRQKIRTKL